MNHQECIELLRDLYGEPLGRCAEYTAAFAEAFPELKRVRGFVTLRSGLRRSHWWLVDSAGKIVDPTASQFDTEYFWHAGIAFYEPLNEANPEPTGMCSNCAGLVYDGGTCCSEKCCLEYEAYCQDISHKIPPFPTLG